MSTAATSGASGAVGTAQPADEMFDVLDETGARTGERRGRKEVHALGLFHRAVHVWLFAPHSGEVLLQRRACCAVRCVSVTRAAGNTGWFAGAFLFVCAAVAWARSAAFILVCRLLLPPALLAVPTF